LAQRMGDLNVHFLHGLPVHVHALTDAVVVVAYDVRTVVIVRQDSLNSHIVFLVIG